LLLPLTSTQVNPDSWVVIFTDWLNTKVKLIIYCNTNYITIYIIFIYGDVLFYF
jgi:hypothetical protein